MKSEREVLESVIALLPGGASFEQTPEGLAIRYASIVPDPAQEPVLDEDGEPVLNEEGEPVMQDLPLIPGELEAVHLFISRHNLES